MLAIRAAVGSNGPPWRRGRGLRSFRAAAGLLNLFFRGAKSHASLPDPARGLAAGVLLCLAVSAPAAPAPASSDIDKYLPDDAQMVAVVNVKQITSWTPFRKQVKDQIEQFIKMGLPAEILKDTGFDPLRDTDRFVLATAADSYKMIQANMTAPPHRPIPPPAPPGAAPPAIAPPPPPHSVSMSTASPLGFPSFFLIQGKFDADKLEAKAQQALKDHPEMVKKPRMVGGIELWEITPPGPVGNHIYLAMLDKQTLMATGLESQALEALDKAAGKRKTDLKDKQVRAALARTNEKAAFQMAASGDIITQVRSESDGKGGFTTTTKTLRDEGFEGFRGAVTLGEADIRYEFGLTAKDADKATETAKSMTDGLEMGIKNVTAAAQQMKDLQPVVDAMKAVKIAASGDTISVEGSATADAVQGAVKAWFTESPRLVSRRIRRRLRRPGKTSNEPERRTAGVSRLMERSISRLTPAARQILCIYGFGGCTVPVRGRSSSAGAARMSGRRLAKGSGSVIRTYGAGFVRCGIVAASAVSADASTVGSSRDARSGVGCGARIGSGGGWLTSTEGRWIRSLA